MLRRPMKMLIPAQLAAAVLMLGAMATWPPASGAMLVVPLGSTDANLAARAALSDGATLLGRGPLPGSLIVRGERAGIVRRLRPWQAIVLAASPAVCGAVAALKSLPDGRSS